MTDHGPPPEWDLLLSASQKNNPDRIRALVTEEGVDVSHANQVGQSALHIASLWGHVESVQVLIKLGANVQAANKITGATPLHSAVQSSKGELARKIICIEKLLEAGANKSAGDHYGSIPFDYCDLEQLKQLLKPQTLPIFQAVENEQIGLIEAIISEDPVCVNARERGKTPLLKILSRILDEESAGSTAIQLQIMELLLNNAADPNASLMANRGGHLVSQEDPDDPMLHQLCRAIMDAYRQGKAERAEHLVQAAKLFAQKDAKLTSETEQLLHDAARRNTVEMAQFLIGTLGVSVNLAGRQGMTPLHFAARSGKVEMVHFLLSQEGIDMNIPDDRGHVALDAAKVNGKEDIVEILEAFQSEHRI